MNVISTKSAPAAIGPYSQAVAEGGMLYTSGQIPLDSVSGQVVGEDIATQTEQVMRNLAAVLEAGGAGFESAVKTTCFLKSMDDFGVFNEIYGKYFTGKPARSCVQVSALPKGVLVEVEAAAALR